MLHPVAIHETYIRLVVKLFMCPEITKQLTVYSKKWQAIFNTYIQLRAVVLDNNF